MPVTSVDTDTEQLTITVIADFTAPLQRLWDAYANPRQIERFWGPPTYPATFLRHDVKAGGRSVYKMVGPEGDEHFGCWEWTAAHAPETFEVVDWFADANGTADTSMPGTRVQFAFEATDDGSRLVTTSHFGSVEQLEQLLEMGMLEGTREAMGQIDAVLADFDTFPDNGRSEGL